MRKQHFGTPIGIEENKELGVVFIEFSNFHDAYKAANVKRHLFHLPYVTMHMLKEPSDEQIQKYNQEMDEKKKKWESKQLVKEENQKTTEDT